MKIYLAYKTELDPTCSQVEKFIQHAGCARWAYNWGLQRKIEVYQAAGKNLTAIDLNKELNILKKVSIENGGVPWMYNSSKCAPQESLRDLDKAYKNFFRRCKSSANNKGFPKFKSRKNGIGNFRLNGIIKVSEKNIQFPNLGKIRLKEHGYLPIQDVKILSATISTTAGRWFVSLQVEQEIIIPTTKIINTVGVDVGIKYLATTSEGKVFENPKALVNAQKKLRAQQKAISRKVKGSNNRKKAALKVAKLYSKITNIRKDTIHKMTTAIIKSASTIVIEDLNVVGMLKNHNLAKSLSDASLSEIHRQLKYKAQWNGVELIKADKFYPSSKRCSDCGNIKTKLSLSERSYKCEVCGLVIDRDLNAALNLKSLAGSFSVSACCPESSDLSSDTQVKLLVGQEPNRFKHGICL